MCGKVRRVDATAKKAKQINIEKIYDFISRIDTLLHKAKQVNFEWARLGWPGLARNIINGYHLAFCCLLAWVLST